MEDVNQLKSKVGEILSKQISDYLPTIDEDFSEQNFSILSSSRSLIDPSKSFATLPYNPESANSSALLDLNFFFDDSSVSLKRNSSFRTARVISHEDTLNFFKMTQRSNEILWSAIDNNDFEEVKSLVYASNPLEFSAQINALGLNNWNSLHMASARGFKEICEVLLTCRQQVNVNAKSSMNRTPLHLASIHGHMKVVNLLLNFGAMVNVLDNEGNTPLHYAASQGYHEIVEILLQAKANAAILNNIGRAPADVSLNYRTFMSFFDYSEETLTQLHVTGYNRTLVNGFLRHNSREDQINKILIKGKILPNQNDLKLFNERPKHGLQALRKQIKIKMPDSKVGPKDFHVLLQLGRGSFGNVYLVEKIDSKELFALKVLDKEKIFRRKIERYAFTERNILMRLTHPFIVKLHFAFQTPEKLALVMDYCPNGDLGMALGRQKYFSEGATRFYIAEIALAIGELHKNNIIFRDLKPDNILIDQHGHIKLTDFGLSKENVGSDILARSFCGSAAYFAPEMIKREGHSKSIDWYVLGAMMYEMISGTPPYYSPDRDSLYKNIKAGHLEFQGPFSYAAKDLISKLLARNPKKRLGASKRDVEEIKEHEFFDDVDWEAFMQKKVEPPKFKTIPRVFKSIPASQVYGCLVEEDDGNQILRGWSMIGS